MTSTPETHAVTGAYGFSGSYIASRLLEEGHRVITLTNSPHRHNPFGKQVTARRYHFNDPLRLVENLKGVRVLYNTYWVRFNHGDFTFDEAVRNSAVLFEAAFNAGVERIVHVSILNPSAASPYAYYRGKAAVEKALRESGVPHAILRPGVLFGKEDILINNIAWMLRTFPVFGVFGDGSYRLQPIYVDDLAAIAVREGTNRGNVVINCTGPESFTFKELVTTLGQIIGRERRIVSVPPWLGYAATRIMGLFVRDLILTREEIGALMDNLLYVEAPPTGSVKLTDWATERRDVLGRSYASELRRRTDRRSAY